MRVENSYSSSSDEDFDGYISEPSTLVSLSFDSTHGIPLTLDSLQNRSGAHRIQRHGGTQSLSENEFDSDDLELPINLKSIKLAEAATSVTPVPFDAFKREPISRQSSAEQ